MEKPRPRKYQKNPLRKYIADPGAMGLFAFAIITFLSGAVHCQWLTTDVQLMLYSPGTFYGGLVQVIAGILDLLRGEKVSGSTFTAFGFFWISNAWLSWPSIEPLVAARYPREELLACVGWYLLGWSAIAGVTTMAVIRTSVLQVILLMLVTVDFFCLALCHLLDKMDKLKAVGYVLVVTAVLAFYIASAFLLRGSSPIHLPIFELSHEQDDDEEWEDSRHRHDRDLSRPGSGIVAEHLV